MVWRRVRSTNEIETCEQELCRREERREPNGEGEKRALEMKNKERPNSKKTVRFESWNMGVWNTRVDVQLLAKERQPVFSAFL